MFIDNETGEVIEENNLQEFKEEMNLIVTDDVLEKLEQVAILQAQVDDWKRKQTDQIKELMKKHGIKSFKNDYISITYKAPTTRKTLDKKAIETLLNVSLDDEMFYKTSEVKESLLIKLKEAGD